MKIEDIFCDLYDLPCWNVVWDSTVNLSMNFGQPSLLIREPKEAKATSKKVCQHFSLRQVTVRGEWLFWIFSAYWKLTTKDFVPVTQSSSHKRKQMALAKLDGQKLIRVNVDRQTAATHLEFDLGAELKIRRYSPDYDGEVWYLYCPSGYVLSVRADGKFQYTLGNISTDETSWKPISKFGDAANARLSDLTVTSRPNHVQRSSRPPRRTPKSDVRLSHSSDS